MELAASIAQLAAVTLLLWTAGVSASPVAKMVGVKTDREGCACIGPFMNVPDQQGVFVIGDASSAMQDGVRYQALPKPQCGKVVTSVVSSQLN